MQAKGNQQGRPRTRYQLAPKAVARSRVLSALDENEYGDARLFAEVFAGQVCYDHTDHDWYLWHGHYWRRDHTGTVRLLVSGDLAALYLRTAAEVSRQRASVSRQIQELKQEQQETLLTKLGILHEQLADQIGALQKRTWALRSARRNSQVLQFIESLMGVTAQVWDARPWPLPVPNGVIDLRKGELRAGRPADYLRTVCPTEWLGLETPCPRFDAFLREIFADRDPAERDALIAFVQRLLGYCITGLTEQHVFPIFYGKDGRNGKDTLFQVLKAVLGPLVGAVSHDVFIAQEGQRSAGAATPHLCDLQGKRLAWGSETKEGDRLNVAQVKLLTGGGEISTRQLHGKQYSFPPTHKLLLLTNHKPHAQACDTAFWARALLIEFGVSFVEEPKDPHERLADPKLLQALICERSGILAWLVRGCLAWQEQGLAPPASVQFATARYRADEDSLRSFLAQCCRQTPEASVKAGVLFAVYSRWCEEHQVTAMLDGKRFGSAMSRRFARKITNIGRIYQGIGLLEQCTVDPASPADDHLIGDASATQGAPSDERPLEGVSQRSSEALGDGGDGFRPIPANMPEQVPPFGENQERTHHSHHHAPSPHAAEAIGMHLDASSDASPEALHPCMTTWEERRAVPHTATGVIFSSGYWWCERCQPQRAWMDLGRLLDYPSITVTTPGFNVQAGEASYLRFAREAGYTFVQFALDRLRAEKEES